ncbi:uncharacterized protein B0J16DRAFT_392175 [Fusarium flagelliforme]|uniref:Apple domain-containing protein n=1 Tax=Fusarium flagelliforme TaxID=2675880 RepID=A0A395N4Y5_9HYPO|nr:uncharacterized protein B0J16DRAFT_392175 [Fusarium flagelliforme]KAH7198420.1 hypothetical protein B0J16DRAFT_392175 [Fusarium flagelliforme]RFN55181.1 hypothetical protein FIE12Z_434 [Fusarium flagelliforme]
MKTSIAILSASMASVMASPFITSTQKCNIAPAGSANGKIKAYHADSADTAVDCQTLCASDDACKSFAFGLIKGAAHPSCLLFNAQASKVPARKDGLHVFDKECASDRVPTSAPTTAQPWGTIPKNVLVRRSTKCNCAASGSANDDVEPYKTTTAATAKDCQALAEADNSCLSFLYGLPDDSETPTCKLFKVAAAKIPARSDKLFVFDKGCSSKQVPTTAPTKDAPRGLVSESASKVTKVQNAPVKATKSAKVAVSDGKENNKAKSNVKPTKVQASKPKVTKVTNAENEKVQYGQGVQDSKSKAKATKVQASKPKVTKATKVQNEQVKATKVSKNENKETSYTMDNKNENSEESKDTKVTQNKDNKTETNKTTENKDTKENNGSDNKDNKDNKQDTTSPKTIITKVRTGSQATQVAKAEGKGSACKTTKVANAQPTQN